MIYICYQHTNSETGSNKSVLDADTDVNALRLRVNAYMATPKMRDFNRGVAHEIPEGKMESRRYHGSGGGCYYTAWLSIEEVRPLQI